MSDNRRVDVWFRRCASFEEEEADADREFWLQYSPEERVALVEEIRKEWSEMTNALQPSKDQRQFLSLLRRHEVRVLIGGAHALAFHAKPRYTKAIDLFVDATAENARRIVALIRNKAASGRAQDLADLELLRRF